MASVVSMSMKSLQRIYEPPIPRHSIPTNNPFYNKQILSPHTTASIAKNLHDKVANLNGSEAARENDYHIANSMPVAIEDQKRSTTPRSLLNWINSSNSKKVQKRMTNRIHYLKHLS
jgi:hypothetical protein